VTGGLTVHTSDSDHDYSAEVAKQERLRLLRLKEKKKETRAHHVARQHNKSSSSSSSSSSRRGVKRSASSRESAACNSKSSSSSSSSNRSRVGRNFVRKEGYEYRFDCDTCDYGTDHSSRMKRHKDMHAGVRYHCPECTHASTTRSSLQVHIRTVHEERKDFKCPVCNKKFGHAKSLKGHRESVHEGVRHECPVTDCDKSYTQRGHCVNHIRREHGGDLSLVPIRRTLD
jgi:uncharacterized Zn-finger protein